MKNYNSKTVVAIVDDDQNILQFLSGLLEEHGLKAHVFNDSLKAPESLKKESFDLVVGFSSDA